MAETYRSYNFTYGDALRVQYETEAGAVQIAVRESGGKVQKTFPQRTPDAPYKKGDTFTIGPELGAGFGPFTVEVEDCSVSDKPLGSTDGRSVDRIWIASVSGRIRGSGAPGDPLDGTSSDVAHPLAYSHSVKSKEGRTARSGSLTLWSGVPVSPYAVGGQFSPLPGGPTLEITDVSISDQVVGRSPDGRLRRLWKIVVSGDEEAGSGSATVNYTFSKERDERGIVLVRGSMTKTSSSETPPAMPGIGEVFQVPCIGGVTCTKLHGTQAAQSTSAGDPPSWSVTVEGAAAAVESAALPEGSASWDYRPNGTVTRDVAGNLVALLRSSTPEQVRRVTVYTAEASHPATPGQMYDGALCTSKRTVQERVTVEGVHVATLYQHEIEVEA